MTNGMTPDPLWYKDAVIYELHVKSFFDGNGDGVGDFKGLVRKLDYLQGLGVDCLWLLPFYPSPLKDDGYDISDYEGIHPDYGTRKDFKLFVNEAHKRGLRVITELVINHTSDKHPWFQRARRAAPGSPERNFYVWSDTVKKYSQARIIFSDSEKSNWTWDPVAKAYYWHRFFHHQPDLNFNSPEVRRAVMETMGHWLDMGVDGLRLDAVPYLVEREGTSCENLPETHAILKDLRSHMDKLYKKRMLLAEANQWPADVRAYFGSGDECHMAFHFPLMPRMFMALRQEDRHPITEIMRQTPDIPENCQWALFLRNHDELTLEMVTDEERDYMYNEYAGTPHTRLNMGIRRRLAPLVEKSRRRLELLNSLLFSFPGTPVIYYGDEIAMGDNVLLGDRNGVRTPMQWTGDRNAGFSRAQPARLFSPPIADPLYGCQAVNVEAQEKDPSSLLHWMKRMIALRKRLKVFSRGSIEFIYPQNRRVLAFVRRYEGETVLVVANLSRFVQPAELDLSAFKGLAPVEMIGRAEFPPIGELPYFITLGPHGFYWLELQRPAAVAVTHAVPFGGIPAVQLEPDKGGWASLFRGNAKRALETDLLPRFLMRQRWFAAKAKKLIYARIIDWGEIKNDGSPSYLVIVRAEFVSGPADTYAVPLGVATGPGAEALAQNVPQAVVARLTGMTEPALLHDALRDDATGTAFFDAMRKNREIQTQNGRVRAAVTSAFSPILRDFDVLPFKPAVSAADQSNTSIFFGQRFVMKLMRRLQPGINPEYDIGRFLTETAAYKNVPRTAGVVDYQRNGEESATLAVLHEQRENQGNGWDHTLGELERFFDLVGARTVEEIPQELLRKNLVMLANAEAHPLAVETIGGALNAAAMLGRRTAELHMALARNNNDQAFSPEPLTAGDIAAFLNGTRDMAKKSLHSLENIIGRLPEDIRVQAHRILSERVRLLERLKVPKMTDLPAGKIRCHGDYHLGQVLWVENDFVLMDFEGEPSRFMSERRAKQSPLKDVAGMLGSFAYAAHNALLRQVKERPQSAASLAPWAAFWRAGVSAAFLKAYLSVAAEAAFLPRDPALLEALLDIFYIDKTFYELQYELNNRPDWLAIPVEKLVALLNRLA